VLIPGDNKNEARAGAAVLSTVAGHDGAVACSAARAGSPALARRAFWLGRSQGFLALGDQAVVSLANFATGLIIGRMCGKNELGLYALAWSLVSIAAGASSALITTPYGIFRPRMPEREHGCYVGSMFLQQIVVSSAMTLIMLLGAAVDFQRRGSAGVGRVLATVAGLMLFIGLRDFVRLTCFAELRVGLALVLDSAGYTAQIGGLVALGYAGRLSACSAYVITGAVAAIVTLAWLYRDFNTIRLSRNSLKSGFERNWDVAKWLLLSGVLWTIGMYLYPWLLTFFHGTAATGAWAACSAIVAIGNPAVLGLGNYIGPKICHVYAVDGVRLMRRYVYRVSLVFSMILLPLVLVLTLWGGKVLVRVYGPAYTGYDIVVMLLALNVLANGFALPYSRGLFALLAPRPDMYINAVAIALLFTVGVVAVRRDSATGAASALLLTTVITAILRVLLFTSRASVPGAEAVRL
jgi:O-antigen/teichoic acid export membrane protein